LIGLITYKGNANFGQCLAYILTNKNEWWLLDNLPNELEGETKSPKQSDRKRSEQSKTIRLFIFYRKLSEYNIATGYNSKCDYINNLEKIEQDIRGKN